MRIYKIIWLLGLFQSLALLPSACTKSYSLGPLAPLPPTPTFTNTPCAFCTPTFTATATPTKTATPTPSDTPTATPTYTTTVTVPMGLYVTGQFEGMGKGLGAAALANAPLVSISVNHNAETTAAVFFNTPNEGAMPLSFFGSTNYGTYTASSYTFPLPPPTYTYIPNGVYFVTMTTSLGTASITVTAPGGIQFSADGSSVTCAYPGNQNVAEVERVSPGFAITYYTPTGTNEVTPLVFPPSAYYASSTPATFASMYTAGTTVTSFAGTAPATGYIGALEMDLETFTR